MIRVIALLLVTLPWSTLAAEPIKIGNDIQLFGDCVWAFNCFSPIGSGTHRMDILV